MTWSIRAFAELAGVTVKALHHYEKRGLLAPQRSTSGYRRYSLRDLQRLERVLALKSLGFPLGQIGALMDGGSTSKATRDRAQRPAAFRTHRDQLVAMRDTLDRAIRSLDAIESDAQPAAAIDRFVRDTAWARWEARRERMASPVARAPDRASPSRFALFKEIAAALNEDPTGAAARPLAARWHALVSSEAGGDAATIAAKRRIAATRAQWPEGARRYAASLYDADVDTWERIMTFIESVRAH